MANREIVINQKRLAHRFGKDSPEPFYYRHENLNLESEELIAKSQEIFESGGSKYGRRLRLLRCADRVPDLGRPAIVREYFGKVEQIENAENGFSLL
jgi:hypothetical protein